MNRIGLLVFCGAVLVVFLRLQGRAQPKTPPKLPPAAQPAPPEIRTHYPHATPPVAGERPLLALRRRATPSLPRPDGDTTARRSRAPVHLLDTGRPGGVYSLDGGGARLGLAVRCAAPPLAVTRSCWAASRPWQQEALPVSTRETVLQTEGLTKVYRSLFTPTGVKAVDGLDLAVREGETYSVVGPNGSGKTTTLKILLGLIFPTSGTATIFGRGIADLEVRERIGFLPEDAYLYDCFSGEELLDFYAGLFGHAKRRRRALVDELLSLVGMQANRRVPFRECSKGMRQRLALAQALVNDPELLILDEPTSGLDPAGRHQMTRLILELKRRGKTILLCSHFLAEVEEVCDRVGIMYRGRLVAEGTLAELAGEC